MATALDFTVMALASPVVDTGVAADTPSVATVSADIAEAGSDRGDSPAAIRPIRPSQAPYQQTARRLARRLA